MRTVREKSDISQPSVLTWIGGGCDGVGRLLKTNTGAATGTALKKEPLENPGSLPRGGGIGTEPWLIMCLPGRDEWGWHFQWKEQQE